ncbi:DUF397 domain-containing protein [Actinomadura opuntiae]|uniref:DUF397 domain-containing protein n=1 Tax=Actinomadura sp. OS1-43 TaxID=604315 RepID=UPI00255B2AEC|nr:DUF397 domain-containing protein [Actinomadura sp. OS1-43]MDL4820779.1 DUF397 domain-containing protein [Actinomadura sp. OS1-43]
MREKYPRWRKARRSEAGSECVEVSLATDRKTIGVRDSKEQGNGPVLEFTRTDWAALLNSLR